MQIRYLNKEKWLSSIYKAAFYAKGTLLIR